MEYRCFGRLDGGFRIELSHANLPGDTDGRESPVHFIALLLHVKLQKWEIMDKIPWLLVAGDSSCRPLSATARGNEVYWYRMHNHTVFQ